MPSVFIVGATGYIGGSILSSLKKAYPTFDFVALVRTPSFASLQTSSGIIAVQGSFQDHEKISQLASEADIVINAADNDNVPLTEDLLRGIKKRWQESGRVGTLIHTSGSAIFLDGTKEGKFVKDGKVWTDSENDVKLLTPSMAHGQVDVPILAAGLEGFVNTFIVCPSGVYGPSVGDTNKPSQFIKLIVGAVLQRKMPIVVNEGSNVYGLIHIRDLMVVYEHVFALALESLDKPVSTSPYSRYFIASSYDISWRELMSSIATELQKRELLANAEPVSLTYEAAEPLASVVGANSVATAERVKNMFGWRPRERKFENDVTVDVEACL